MSAEEIQRIVKCFLDKIVDHKDLTVYGNTLVIGKNNCPLEQCLRALRRTFPTLSPWAFTMETHGLILSWQYTGGGAGDPECLDKQIAWSNKRTYVRLSEDVRLVCLDRDHYMLTKGVESYFEDYDDSSDDEDYYEDNRSNGRCPLLVKLLALIYVASTLITLVYLATYLLPYHGGSGRRF